MKAQIELLGKSVVNLTNRFDVHLEEYAERKRMHAENNLMQIEFAKEVNKLNAQIAQQGLILGEHGVSLGRHEKVIEAMERYIAVQEDRLSTRRYLIDVALKVVPIVVTILAVKAWG